MRKIGRLSIAATTLALTVTMLPAQGTPASFTWRSAGSVVCVNPGCTQARADFGVTGFGFDQFGLNLGTYAPLTFNPAAPSPTNQNAPTLSTPGFLRGFSISALDGMGVTFAAALNGTNQNGFDLTVTDGGRTLVGTRNNSPLVRSPASILMSFTAPPGGVAMTNFEISGTAYLADNTDFTWFAPNGRNYDVGSFRLATAVIPEPSTYALMATGLAGLTLVSRRRRRA